MRYIQVKVTTMKMVGMMEIKAGFEFDNEMTLRTFNDGCFFRSTPKLHPKEGLELNTYIFV